MDDKHATDLRALAEAAAEMNDGNAKTVLDHLLEGMNMVPKHLQLMIDSIVAMQKAWPMPHAGWEQFIKDIEYTNERHNLNLHIKPELMED